MKLCIYITSLVSLYPSQMYSGQCNTFTMLLLYCIVFLVKHGHFKKEKHTVVGYYRFPLDIRTYNRLLVSLSIIRLSVRIFFSGQELE